MSAALNKSIDRKLFSQLEPLDTLSADRHNELAAKSQLIQLLPGQTLFKGGERDKRVLYLINGELELVGRDGSRTVLRAGTPEARKPLAPQQPRPATAQAKTPASILSVDADLLDVLLGWGQTGGYEVSEIDFGGNSTWMMSLFQSQSLLNLPPETIQTLINRLEKVDAKSGQIIFVQNDSDDHYYIIAQGRARVTRKPTPQAENIPLAELGPGDTFGEEALITSSRRNATISMLEDGILLRLNKNDFFNLLARPLLRTVSYQDAKYLIESDAVMLDVRNNDECGENPAGTNIPLSLLRLKANTLDKKTTYITCCNNGKRSATAAFILRQRGFTAYTLHGGLDSLPVGSTLGLYRVLPSAAPQAPATARVGGTTIEAKLQQALSTQQKQLLELTQRAEAAERAGRHSAQEAQQLSTEIDKARTAKAQQEQEIRRLRNEIDARLQAETMALEQVRGLTRQIDDLQKSRSVQEQEVARLTADLESLRRQAADGATKAHDHLTDCLRAEISQLQARIDEQNRALQSADHRRQEAEQDSQALHTQIAQLREQVAQAESRFQANFDAMTARETELARRVSTAEQERSGIEQALVQAQMQLAEALAQQTQQHEATQALEQARQAAIERSGMLQAQLAESLNQLGELEQRVSMAEQAHREVEEQHARLLQELEDARGQAAQAQARLQNAEQAIQAGIEERTSQLRGELVQEQSRQGELLKQIGEAQYTRQGLEQRITELERTLEAERQNSARTAASLQEAEGTLQQRVDERTAQLRTELLQEQSRQGDLLKQIDEMQQARQSLERQIAEFNRLLEAERQSSAQARTDLQRGIEQHSAALRNELQQEQARHAALRAQVEQAQQTRQGVEQQVVELRQSLEAERQNSAQARADLQKVKQSLQTLAMLEADMRVEVISAQNRLEEQTRRAESAEHGRETLEQEILALKAEVETARHSFNQAAPGVELDAELLRRLEVAEATHDELLRRTVAAEQGRQKAEAINTELHGALETMRDELTQALQARTEMESRIDATLANTQQELSQLRSALEEKEALHTKALKALKQAEEARDRASVALSQQEEDSAPRGTGSVFARMISPATDPVAPPVNSRFASSRDAKRLLAQRQQRLRNIAMATCVVIALVLGWLFMTPKTAREPQPAADTKATVHRAAPVEAETAAPAVAEPPREVAKPAPVSKADTKVKSSRQNEPQSAAAPARVPQVTASSQATSANHPEAKPAPVAGRGAEIEPVTRKVDKVAIIPLKDEGKLTATPLPQEEAAQPAAAPSVTLTAQATVSATAVPEPQGSDTAAVPASPAE